MPPLALAFVALGLLPRCGLWPGLLAAYRCSRPLAFYAAAGACLCGRWPPAAPYVWSLADCGLCPFFACAGPWPILSISRLPVAAGLGAWLLVAAALASFNGRGRGGPAGFAVAHLVGRCRWRPRLPLPLLFLFCFLRAGGLMRTCCPRSGSLSQVGFWLRLCSCPVGLCSFALS